MVAWLEAMSMLRWRVLVGEAYSMAGLNGILTDREGHRHSIITALGRTYEMTFPN